MGKVECDQNRNLCYRFDVNKYPEIRLVNQRKLIKMNQKIDIHHIIDFIIQKRNIKEYQFIPE